MGSCYSFLPCIPWDPVRGRTHTRLSHASTVCLDCSCPKWLSEHALRQVETLLHDETVLRGECQKLYAAASTEPRREAQCTAMRLAALSHIRGAHPCIVTDAPYTSLIPEDDFILEECDSFLDGQGSSSSTAPTQAASTVAAGMCALTEFIISVANSITTYLLKMETKTDEAMNWELFVQVYTTVLRRVVYALGGTGHAREIFVQSTQHKSVWDAGFGKVKTLGAGSFGVVHLAREPAGPGPGSRLRRASTTRPTQVLDRSSLRRSLTRRSACSDWSRGSMVVDGREVVVKEIKKDATTEQLSDEIGVLLRLDHPHIIRIFSAYEDAEYLYMVFDVAKGGELQHVINTVPAERICESFIKKVMRQVLRAVSYCHGRMVIHKDLKAANIMLMNVCDPTAEQVDPHAVVIDFGVAETFLAGVSASHSALMGTPHTMAPELWRGFQNREVLIGPKVDIWACGCILFQLFSGKEPFSVLSVKPKPWLRAIAKGLRMQLLVPSCSDEVRSLIRCMLAVNVNARFSARRCLRASWFNPTSPRTLLHSVSTPQIHHPVNDGVVLRLFNYSRHNQIFRAVLMKVASQLSPLEVPEINGLFDCIDTDDSGVIKLTDFVRALRSVGVGMEEAADYFNCVDWSGDGNIQYTEFIAAMLSDDMVTTGGRLWRAFQQIDTDRSGFIDVEEVELLGAMNVRERRDDFPHKKDGRASYEVVRRYFRQKSM